MYRGDPDNAASVRAGHRRADGTFETRPKGPAHQKPAGAGEEAAVRNWLHEAWLLLDEHIVQIWTPQIKALDDRYKAATVDDDGQALHQFHRQPGPDLWWWRRHPRILTGDLGRSPHSVGAIGIDLDPA
ncbi:hypothetical protein [Streptomyces sp. NPDC057748]